jgi:hypothetical protein
MHAAPAHPPVALHLTRRGKTSVESKLLAEIEDRTPPGKGAAPILSRVAGGIMSDWQTDFDRLAVDLNNRDAQTSSSKRVWVYVDISKVVGGTGQSKVFASLELAKAWFTENDPEGIAFEYSLIDRIEE